MVFNRSAVCTFAALNQNLSHLGHEVVHIGLIERVEAVRIATEGDGIKGKPVLVRQHKGVMTLDEDTYCKVISTKDLIIRALSVPFEDHLRCDIQHSIKHLANIQRTEHRHQDSVGEKPLLV